MAGIHGVVSERVSVHQVSFCRPPPPKEATPLITGRDRERGELQPLAGRSHFNHLGCPGGSGKTHLALHASITCMARSSCMGVLRIAGTTAVSGAYLAHEF